MNLIVKNLILMIAISLMMCDTYKFSSMSVPKKDSVTKLESPETIDSN